MLEEIDISWLSQLRLAMPLRELSVFEAANLLERQAAMLLDLAEIAGPPVPLDELVSRMSHIVVRRVIGIPVSGRTRWIGRTWVILIARDEPSSRQRFTLGHELGHVLLHSLAATCVPGTMYQPFDQRLEIACDYFAACLLMPRPWIKRAYFGEGIQDSPALADLFAVSFTAMQRRLRELGVWTGP